MSTVIYTNTDADVSVLHDAADETYPIGIDHDGVAGWLSRNDALVATAAIREALAAGAADTVVLASEVSFNEGVMRLAAAHGKTVTFRYAKRDGSVIETRTLQPTEVKECKGHLIFVGYDPDREEPRSYRVDRMKGEVSVI